MPESVSSLKKQNRELKANIESLSAELITLKDLLTDRNIPRESANESIIDETQKSLEFMSNAYDELNDFQGYTKRMIQRQILN